VNERDEKTTFYYRTFIISIHVMMHLLVVLNENAGGLVWQCKADFIHCTVFQTFSKNSRYNDDAAVTGSCLLSL